MGRRRIAELAAGLRSDVDGQIGANNGEVHPARETNQNTKADVLWGLAGQSKVLWNMG